MHVHVRYDGADMTRPTYQLAVVVADRRARIAFVLLLLGAVAISLASIFVRMSAVGAIPTAFWRMALAVPCLAAVMPLLPQEPGRTHWPDKWSHVAGFALAGLVFAGDMAAFNYSVGYTTIANATLLPNTAPIFVAIYTFLLFGTRFTRQFIVGMAAALLGVILVMGDSLEVGREHFFGDMLGLLAAMFYSAYFMIVARLRAQFSGAAVILLTAFFTALFLLPLFPFLDEAWLPDQLEGWMVLAGLAAISQALGQGLIAFAFAFLPPAFGAVTLLLQPVLSAIFAWMLFGEALGIMQGIGIFIVLTGVLVARQGVLRGSSA